MRGGIDRMSFLLFLYGTSIWLGEVVTMCLAKKQKRGYLARWMHPDLTLLCGVVCIRTIDTNWGRLFADSLFAILQLGTSRSHAAFAFFFSVAIPPSALCVCVCVASKQSANNPKKQSKQA